MDPKTDPLAVVEAGADPKTDPLAVVEAGADPKTDPLEVVDAGVDPKTEPLEVVEAGADPKTDPPDDEEVDAVVPPNAAGDPLGPPKAEDPVLCPPKTDPEACVGFDPKTELAEVVVTALEDPKTEVDVDPPNADPVAVEATGAVEDDPNTDPEDAGAFEEDPNTDPVETDGVKVDEPDEAPPKIPPELEEEPPKAVLLGGAPPKTLEAPEPPNTELEAVVVVELVLDVTPTDDVDSALVSDPDAVDVTLPPELAGVSLPNKVLAAPPKGLFSLAEDGTVEASVFFTVTEKAEELKIVEEPEPKAGTAEASVKAVAIDVVGAETVAVADLAPKFSTNEDDEPPISVIVVDAVSKSSLVAAGNFSPPEGAVDDKPKPSFGAALVTAVVTVAVELRVAEELDFAKPNENPDFESPDPSDGTVAVVVNDVVVGLEAFTSGTGFADPNANPEAGTVEDRLNPEVGADVVTALVVDEVPNGELDPVDDKDRPKPSPGLLEASGTGFVVV